MMRLAAIFVVLALWATTVSAVNTFLLNMPKYIRPGNDFEVFLELFEFPAAGSHCNISIRYEQDASSALVWPDAFKTIRLSNSQKKYEKVFYAPFELYSGAKLFVHVAFQGVRTKPRVEGVSVKRMLSAIFLATDKSTYKPSEIVKFVVGVFDADLKPKDAAFKLQIEAPDGTPIMSKIVESTDGSTVYQGELELSADVIQGKYAISGNLKEEFSYVEKYFVVEEYVLPKFSCEMVLDSNYAVTEGGAPANVKGTVICKYTYGQLVNGKLDLYIGKQKKLTVTDYSGDYQFDLPLTGYDASTLGKTTANIRAEMTEKDTGKMDNVTASYTIYSSHFAAQVKNPPVRASNEKDYTCQVELVNSMGGPLSQWGDATTIDITNYELRYTVNGQSTYQSVAVTENPVTLTIPAMIGDVTVNFGSAIKVWFVYMSKMPNGYRQSIPASFTPPVLQSNSNEPLHVQRVASSNSQEVCFKITPCTDKDQVYFQVVNNFRPESIMTYSSCELDDPVCFTTRKEHAPMSMLVAFKVVAYSEGRTLRKELLTASLSFKKDFETDQQVEISVSPAAPQTVRPGDEVTLTFKTVGQGMVHYSGVDKSVELMRNPNNINMQEIESAWAAGRLFKEMRENPHPNPPGMPIPRGIMVDEAPVMVARRKKRSIACFSWPCYSNRYTNPSKVLQDAGLTTITDLQFYSSGGYSEEDRVFVDAADGGLGGAIVEGNDWAIMEAAGAMPDAPIFNKGQDDAEWAVNNREDIFANGRADGIFLERERVFAFAVPMADRDFALAVPKADVDLEENDRAPEAKLPTDAEMDEEMDEEVEEPRVRTEFPETWLWDHIQTNTAGPAGTYTATKTVTVPDTITSWVARGFGYNMAKGLGVAGPVEVTVFQPFFLSMNLPYSVINGEVLHLQVIIFNYRDTEQQVNFILEANPDWFTVITKGAQSKSQLLSQSVTIGKSSSKSVLVPLRLKKIGDLVLKASARSSSIDGQFSDAVERTLIVEPEGLPISDGTELAPVNFINNGDVRTVDMDTFLSISRDNIVPDSYRMYIHVTGDMMGPFITIITGKLQMPYGCGEQNIMSMSPSIYVALYLGATGRLDPDIAAKCQRYSAMGYQRQLKYMHLDGSFTAFGQGHGATGLTAIVLKAFSTLAQTDMTYVSRVNLQKSFRFLANVTNPANTNSYFEEHGHVIHTEMQGGAAKNLSLTAYCLGAIMELKDVAVVDQNDDLVEEIDGVLEGGLEWLLGKLDTHSGKLSNFQLTITAYVFARASKSDDNYYSEAKGLLESYEETKDETQPPPLKCPYVIMFANVRGKMPDMCLEKDLTTDSCTTDADCTRKGELCCSSGCGGTKTCTRGMTPSRQTGPTEIETQGYALMAYSLLSTKAPSQQERDALIQKAMGYASSLISMRGPGGQFRTTQDTMVAMEALTRYALANPMSTGASFRVQALMGGSPVTDWVNVDNDNYIATQTAKLDVPPSAPPTGEITFNYEGTAGNAYVTVEALYNTIDGEPHSSLDGKVVTSIDDKKRKYIETCISNMDDNVSISPMVVAKVKCETGKMFAEVAPGQTSDISKVEINKNECGVTFYMMNDAGDNLKNERCYKFMVEEEFDVEDQKPGTLEVYDYYNPDNNYQSLFKSDYMVQETRTTEGPTTGCSHAQVSLVLLLLTALLAVVQALDRQ